MLGTYKPQIHTHYLPHLSLSFARHTNCLNTTFVLLSQDYSKSLHLQSDRSLEFHTPGGCHYTTRLPRYGRDLKYDNRSAEALLPAVGVNENGMGEVFRLNLEVGRYMRGYEIDVGDYPRSGLQGGTEVGSVNVASVATESHNLLAFGTSIGTVEFWDPRSHGRVGRLQYPSSTGPSESRQQITSLQFSRTGLGLATGSSAGLIHLYDLRSPFPILKKDQGYGYPIHTLTYLESSSSTRDVTSEPKILSSDKRIIKIWDSRDGTPWTSVEPAVDINAVTWCKDSGMLLTANEGRQQHSFFVPQLGPAPKWCSFLDNLVEEMAEDPNDPNAFAGQKVGDVYDNYKFLTTAQLESLNLSHLIGTTSLLRPYMHGFFVAQRLYEEAKLIADPFVWEEQRNNKIKQKIEAERESRIRGNKQVTAKVNKRLAEKILERQDREKRRQARRVLDAGGENGGVVTATVMGNASPETNEIEAEKSLFTKPDTLLADSRFAQMFHDEDFAIDETSREFQSLNPSSKPLDIPVPKDKDQRQLTAVEEEAVLTLPASDSENDRSEEEIPVSKARRDDRLSSASYKKSAHRPQHQQQPLMKISSSHKPQQSRDRSFGSRSERSSQLPNKSTASTLVGEREIRFIPEPKVRKSSKQQPGVSTSRQGKGRRSASGNVFRNI